MAPSKPRPAGRTAFADGTHRVVANHLGLFDVVAGGDRPVSCDFNSQAEAEAFLAECIADDISPAPAARSEP